MNTELPIQTNYTSRQTKATRVPDHGITTSQQNALEELVDDTAQHWLDQLRDLSTSRYDSITVNFETIMGSYDHSDLKILTTADAWGRSIARLYNRAWQDMRIHPSTLRVAVPRKKRHCLSRGMYTIASQIRRLFKCKPRYKERQWVSYVRFTIRDLRRSAQPRTSTNPLKPRSRIIEGPFFERAAAQEISDSTSQSLAPFAASVLSVIPVNCACVFLHELAHAAAMKMLYADVNPTIVINWRGGHTAFGGAGEVRTAFGENFSLRTARGLVLAAGPVIDFVRTTAMCAASLRLRHKHPGIAHCLSFQALISSIMSLHYSMIHHPASDYHGMSINFSVSQAYFTGITMLYTVYAGYSWRAALIALDPPPHVKRVTLG